MISYEGWDRDYLENKEDYIKVFDKFMSQSNYENNESFEKKFSTLIGRKYVVSVANATDALRFTLMAHNIGPGDEVLVPDFSWVSTASCVSMVGATPVFCDIDLDSYHISLDSIKKMFSEKTKAVIYVHLFGNMVDTSNVQNFCREKNIIFIEDSSQSLGSSLNGVPAGTLGDSSVYSFNTNKVVAGINGGGVLMTDNEAHAKKVKLIRKHGKDKDFEILGYNSRMYVLNAEIINLRLEKMVINQIKRQEIANYYNESFKDLPVKFQTMKNGLNHNYHKYTLKFLDTNTRNKIKNLLNVSIHYDKPISKNPMYEGIAHRKDDCVNANNVSNTILSLPIHSWLTESEINNIIDVIKKNL